MRKNSRFKIKQIYDETDCSFEICHSMDSAKKTKKNIFSFFDSQKLQIRFRLWRIYQSCLSTGHFPWDFFRFQFRTLSKIVKRTPYAVYIRLKLYGQKSCLSFSLHFSVSLLISFFQFSLCFSFNRFYCFYRLNSIFSHTLNLAQHVA